MTQTPVFTKKGPQPTSTTHTSTHTPTNTPLIPTADLVDQPPLPQPTLASTLTEPPHVSPRSIASTNQPTNPFAIYQKNLASATAQPVQWLWQNRLPLAGITLLDGDHGLGKSLLALQLAAAVSSGKPMPDGSPTIQGGVIIITPFTDASTTQLQRLIALGADLKHIEFLSFVHDPAAQPPDFPLSGSRPFSLPEDLTRLVEAIERVNARLIILDPFIYLLSRHLRYTNRRLSHLLTDLDQLLIDRNIACLLVRRCRARGGHAHPSALEKSDHFSTVASSHLLLAPDPMQPKHILLSHVHSRHCSLTQTLTLQIQSLPTSPDFPYITTHGHHILTSEHLLTQRPDTLNRQLLSKLLLAVLVQSPEPLHATTLCALFPDSSPYQIHHSLKDLLLLDHIQRPARGFYSSSSSNTAYPTTPKLNPPAATTSDPIVVTKLNLTAATTPTPKLNPPAATTPTIATKLSATAAITSTSQLATTAATTPTSATITKLNHSPATRSTPITAKLNAPAATTSTPTTPKLNIPAATTSDPIPAKKLNPPVATTPAPKPPRPHKHPHKQKKSHGRPR